jgi:hypothetical protein
VVPAGEAAGRRAGYVLSFESQLSVFGKHVENLAICSLGSIPLHSR